MLGMSHACNAPVDSWQVAVSEALFGRKCALQTTIDCILTILQITSFIVPAAPRRGAAIAGTML